MTELNRAQLQAWECSLELASGALDEPSSGPGRLRGRLRSTVSALRESVESIRRLVDTLTAARREITAQKERLSAVIEHLPIPYLLTREDGTILDCNAAASTALNVSARALVGRNVLLFLDDRDGWRLCLAGVAAARVAAGRNGNLRPRERLQETITAHLSIAAMADSTSIQWFLTTAERQGARSRPAHVLDAVRSVRSDTTTVRSLTI